MGAVDPEPRTGSYKGEMIRVVRSVAEAIDEWGFDVAVVMSPTGTHCEVTDEVIEKAPWAKILVEKPLGGPNEDPRGIRAKAVERGVELVGMFHSGFAPEVLWGLDLIKTKHLGDIVGFSSLFMDPYKTEADRAVESLVSSWFDSGPNALSVIGRFLDLSGGREIEKLPGAFSTYRGVIDARRAGVDGERGLVNGAIFCSWEASSAAQSTVFDFESGARLVLNHTACTGQLVEGNRLVEFFANDPAIHRRTAHYMNLYAKFSESATAGLEIVNEEMIEYILDLGRQLG